MVRTASHRIMALALLALAAGLAVLVARSLRPETRSPGPLQAQVGHDPSPLLAFLYAASGEPGWEGSYQLVRMGSPAHVGYALLAGSIQAGFIEPERVLRMQPLRGFDELRVAGKVTFPYGATLVVAQGKRIRLDQLQGLRLAVAPNDRRLIGPFVEDVKRFGLTLTHQDFQLLAPDAIIPALEAGEVDAALTKGARAALAQHAGHPILYQRWDLQPGDECCPAIIDQLEYVLLVRRDFAGYADLVARLERAAALPPDSLRAAAARAVRGPQGASDNLPLAAFQPAGEEILTLVHAHAHHGQEQRPAAVSAPPGTPGQAQGHVCAPGYCQGCPIP